MNWDAIGAIGEIVGAISVIVTLVYLASQIRHSVSATKALVRDSVSRSIVEINRFPIDDATLASAYRRYFAGEDLNEDDAFRLQRVCTIWLRTYENVYFQYRNGFLDENEWLGHLGTLQDHFSTQEGVPIMKERFHEMRESLSPEFVSLIESKNIGT